jgi:hypothetical protein
MLLIFLSANMCRDPLQEEKKQAEPLQSRQKSKVELSHFSESKPVQLGENTAGKNHGLLAQL